MARRKADPIGQVGLRNADSLTSCAQDLSKGSGHTA